MYIYVYICISHIGIHHTLHPTPYTPHPKQRSSVGQELPEVLCQARRQARPGRFVRHWYVPSLLGAIITGSVYVCVRVCECVCVCVSE